MYYLKPSLLRLLLLKLALLLCICPPLWVQAAPNLTIKIEGIEGELLKNTRLLMTIVRENAEQKEALPKISIQRYHRLAEREIQQALQPFGYYQPQIETSLTAVPASADKAATWLAEYRIQAGEQSRYASVNIELKGEGKDEPAVLALIQEQRIQKNDGVNHPRYEALKQALFDSVFEAGYLDAQFTRSELLVDANQSSASVYLSLETGARYFFGPITIEQDILSPEFLKKYIRVDENTPFDTDALLDLQLSLNDSGYFSQVDVEIQREHTKDQRIPVRISTSPNHKYRYKTSAGFGTDTGARVGFGFLNRRVNANGHRLESELRISEVESNISLQYKIPTGDVRSEYIDFTAKANREDINEVVTTQYNVGTSLNHNRWGGRRKLSLNAIEEQFTFEGEPSQRSTLLIPGITYSYKQADNTLFSRKGYSFLIDVHGSVESPVSETTFLQVRVNGRMVRPLGPQSRFLSRFELGATSTDHFDELPPSERFFTGGAQSVRGFGYKDIGARNAAGTNIGGQYLLTASLEVDRLFWGNSGLALFYDVGDATDSRRLSLKQSIGIGYRYRSPVGMIRVDLAHPYNEPDGGIRLHFSIGPDL